LFYNPFRWDYNVKNITLMKFIENKKE